MAKFNIGTPVTVRVAYPRGHIRTPYYIRGKTGVVAAMVGTFRNPETLATGGDGLPEQPLYRIRFRQSEAWPGYTGAKADTLDVEIYEHWLEPAETAR